MKLPEEVIEVCHKHGIYGRIYIPKPRSEKDLKKEEIKNAILQEMEECYEKDLETFLNSIPPAFTVRRVRYRYRTSTQTASSALRAAFAAWQRWFKTHEEEIFSRLSTPERIEYLKTRSYLRKGKQITDTRFKTLAINSLETCPWHSKTCTEKTFKTPL